MTALVANLPYKNQKTWILYARLWHKATIAKIVLIVRYLSALAVQAVVADWSLNDRPRHKITKSPRQKWAFSILVNILFTVNVLFNPRKHFIY